MFANSSASLAYLKKQSSELLNDISFDQNMMPHIEGAKGQAVEHMERYIKCQSGFICWMS